MRKIVIFIASMLIMGTSFSQISVDKVIKKTEKKVNERVEKKVDKTIDKGLDKAEEGIDNSTKTSKNSKPKTDAKTTQKETKPENITTEVQTPPSNQNKPTLTWAKYDFVPGTEIIFEDNQEGEQNGEFPSKWDLVSGQIENANFDGDNLILFRKCNTNGIDGIVPLMKNTKQDYLPEEFTIEFDAYFEKPSNTYRIYLLDTKNQKNIDPDNNVSKRFYLRFDQNSANGKDIQTSFYPGFSNANVNKSTQGWRHIAISFNKRALKAYIDDARVINVPNIGINPLGITLGFHNPSGNLNGFIKNVRIAKGAVPLYDKVLTDGKFITTGIKFDVNKSTIKPESMGTINYVVKMMQDNPEIKFSVEGHTDSDGDDASNLKLSEARAKAILNKLVELGISKDRLTSKGLGETKPMVTNDTSENKAQNRRVEFVKF